MKGENIMEEDIRAFFEGLEDLAKAADILGDIAPATNSLDTAAFLSLVCMLIEEHCKANELDIFETVNSISSAVKSVNEVFGAY